MKHASTFTSFFILLYMVISFMAANAQNQTNSSTSTPHARDQIFEWSNMPVFTPIVKTAQNDESGSWFIGGQLHDPITALFRPSVVKLTPSGEELWSYPSYFEWEVGEVTKIENTSDGSVLAGGWCMLGCDYTPTGIFLHKINNTSGQAIWRKIFVSDDSWDGEVYEILELENGEIVLLCRHSFYKASASGDSLLAADFDLGISNQFTSGLAQDEHLLLGHETGIIETDLEGMVISEYELEGPVWKITAINQQYNIVAGKKVIRTDTEMNILGSYDFSALVGDDFQVTTSDDGFIITGDNQILQIDSTPSLISIHPFETPGNYEIVDISTKDNILFTAGNTSGASGNFAMNARTYTLEGNTVEYAIDAGLSNIRVENIEVVESSWQPDLFSIYWDTWVTVHNFGSDTLRRCDLTSHMVAMSICGYWAYLIPQEELNLLPGESLEVFLGKMEDFGFYLPGADSLIYPLKLFSMQPNDKIDRNPANDMAEITFTVDLSVGIDEISKTKINIYPNPANEYVFIENPANETIEWEIFSIQNKSVLQGTVDINIHRIDISKLKPGIYMMSVSTGNTPAHNEKLIVM
jgi:Ca2+-binding RTX toxin-like protein